MTNWIFQNDPPPNPSVGNDLNGFQIIKVSTGYELIDSSGSVLATTTKTSPPLEFDNVAYDGETWNVHVANPLNPGSNGSGTWHKHGRSSMPTGPQDGDFTAQAGSGLGEEPCEAADSAKA